MGTSALTSMLILVAANSPSDANSAALKLRALGHQVVTCTTTSKMLQLTRRRAFDVVLAEAARSDGQEDDGVDAFRLLRDASSCAPPVIVAMDRSDASAVSRAVQQGALDVVGLPLQDQNEVLNNLWTRDLTPRPTAPGADFGEMIGGEGCLLSSIFNIRDDGLDVLELEPLACDFPEPSRDLSVEEPQDSEMDVISGLFDPFDHITAEGDFDIMESLSTEPSWVSSSDTSSLVSDQKRPRDYADCASPLSVTMHDEAFLSSAPSDGPECNSKAKKSKVDWTPELHKKFVGAVESLGVKEAVPCRILDRMGPCAEGLTRQNVASHLQKYRRRRRSSKPQRARAQAAAPIVLQAPPAAMVSAASSMAFQTVPAVAHQLQVAAHQWPPMVQMLSPWPQAHPVMYNQLPVASSAFPPQLAGPFPTQVAIQQTGVAAPEAVRKAIMDVLAAPKAKAPLGLSLDMSGIMKTLETGAGKHHAAASVA